MKTIKGKQDEGSKEIIFCTFGKEVLIPGCSSLKTKTSTKPLTMKPQLLIIIALLLMVLTIWQVYSNQIQFAISTGAICLLIVFGTKPLKVQS